MASKVLFVIFFVSIFYYFALGQSATEYVSSVLKNTKLPPNWFRYEGKTYYVGTVLKANFYGAWQYCRQQNMQLLSINSREESDRIAKFITDNGLINDQFWTSGTNFGDGKTWVWLSSGKKISYTNWYPDQPDNYDSSENCIEVKYWEGKGFLWNDEGCLNEVYFICESVPGCK